MANNTLKRLMARIREIRKARGWSQEAFAERAGLKYKHYQSVEAGRKPNVQLPTLEKLAKACGMELWELLRFDDAAVMVGEDPPDKGHPKNKRPA